ncbi:MAG: hypothetical protein IT558_05090 [Alphaproteobacteria bacterium]|nr:hypothetical protein [Alphaproteobacteria bacterium]
MTATNTWIPLNREKSPVQASVQLVNDLKAAGHGDVVSLSIGAESEKPQGKIGQLLTVTGTCDPDYNSAVGGKPHIREAVAAWINRYLGMPATSQNTFLVPTNGRGLLNHAFHIAKRHVPRGKDALLGLPDTSWPMVDESAEDSDLVPAYYEVIRGKLPQEVFKTASRYVVTPKGPYALAAVYTNTPHNPTGIHIAASEMQRFMSNLNAYNTMFAKSDRKGDVLVPEIMHIIDNPYFAACPQQKTAPYLINGYETALTPDCRTPWMAAVSFSKAYGTARPGLSAFVVHNSLIKEVSARLSRNDGLSYFPELFENFAQVVHPNNDKESLEHFGKLAAKYSRNRQLADRYLGGMLRLVDGDSNMTALFEVPEDFLGKEVLCHDGQRRIVKDVNDIVEIAGNHSRIVPVNNSTDRDGVKRNYLRFALRESDPQKTEQAFSRIAKALNTIRNSNQASQVILPIPVQASAAPAVHI